MDNKVKNKDSKALVTIIVLLIIIIIILGLYILMDKGIIKINNTTNKTKQITTEVKKTETKQAEAVKEKVYNYTELKDFWQNFRNDILTSNYEEIEKYVKFPLQKKAEHDSDSIVNVSQTEFEKLFKSYLKQDTGLGNNTTEFDWIKNNEMPTMLSGKEYESVTDYTNVVRVENNNWARFNNMVVEKDTNGYWKLSLIYIIEN